MYLGGDVLTQGVMCAGAQDHDGMKYRRQEQQRIEQVCVSE